VFVGLILGDPTGVQYHPFYDLMKPISLDLRQRIVDAYERGEGSQAKIAKRFGVGISTIKRLLKQWRTTGSLQLGKPGGPLPFLLTVDTARIKAVDESGVVQGVRLAYGYPPRGERLVCHAPLRKSKRLSLLGWLGSCIPSPGRACPPGAGDERRA
jgi:transposase-like protein